ncbi:hypothetical protein GGX14DRAFT_395508 [Mycena pura]|uniref:Uncharacterized protein n=1 Tax=Mycena pura TaxID=153505 RepID=A0AAD6VC89_9AGAR|nr:hypothetical protein GGX14DRAFT_395508 [Mycena pura]
MGTDLRGRAIDTTGGYQATAIPYSVYRGGFCDCETHHHIFAEPPHSTTSFAVRPLCSAAQRVHGSHVRASDHGDLINPAAPVHRGDGAGLRSDMSGCKIAPAQVRSVCQITESVFVDSGVRLSRIDCSPRPAAASQKGCIASKEQLDQLLQNFSGPST